MRDPSYVIVGYPRPGTNCVTKAVALASDLVPVVGRYIPKFAAQFEDAHYKGNPEYWEPDPVVLNAPDFPVGYEGRLFKIMWDVVEQLAPMPGGLRLVLMLRDPEELRQSFEGMTRMVQAPYGRFCTRNYWERMEHVQQVARDRPDMEMVTLHYRDELIADPVKAFTKLRDAGWPIDVEKAASVVDPSLCRFKVEELVVGL